MNEKKSSEKYFALALRGGKELIRKRTDTTMGIRFPAEPYPGKQEVRFEFKLYDGSAGVGITLLDLFQATNDQRYVELCEEIGNGLIQSTPEFGPIHPGLYGGVSGIGLFHLAYARALSSRKALERAIQLATRVAATAYVDTDLYGGAAGAGLFLIALYYATGDPAFLNGARSAAEFLADTAVAPGDAAAWFGRDPKQPLHTTEESYVELATQIHHGLAHGVAGICLFLIELANITDDQTPIQLYQRGFRWLDAKAMSIGNGLVWTRSETNRIIQNHWCHGSAGIAHAYLALYRHAGDAKALRVATAAGEATWDSLKWNENEITCHCHGISGAIELFLELNRHRAGRIWRTRALQMANRIEHLVHTKKAGIAAALGMKSTGLGLGTAGVIRQFLRLSGVSIFPMLTPVQNRVSLKRDPASKISETAKRPRPRFNIDVQVSDIVPRAGIRMKGPGRFVEIGPLQPDAAKKTLRMIEDAPAGDAYFHSLNEIGKACAKLRARYSHRLLAPALDATALGGLLREIAGMTLRSEAHPDTVRNAAARMTRNAIAALHLMFKRLDADMHGILTGEVTGRLRSVHVCRSDPHRYGQRVVQLQFEEGPTLLYKARPLAIDHELAGSGINEEHETIAARCRKWLQPAVDRGLLPTHRLIPANTWYGYAEMIETVATPFPYPHDLIPENQHEIPPPRATRLRAGDEPRFWYSAGLLAGHAFTFGIQDLHAENVICGRSRSTDEVSMHAIDVEMAFGNAIDLEDTHLIDGPRWNGEPRKHSHAAFDFTTDFACALYAEDWVVEMTGKGPSVVSRPWQASRWIFPHLVQNSDGSLGYGAHVCSFLRGFADQWALLQSRSSEIRLHLMQKLVGTPMRVVLNPTRNYAAALSNRKLGGEPIAGIAINPAIPFARRFLAEEVQQLNELDVPYFFRFLENDGTSESTVCWFKKGASEHSVLKQFPRAKQEHPFASIIDRQADPGRIARAVVDIAWAIVPDGPFDFHDPALGIRIVRTAEDHRVIVVVLLGEKRDQRLTCRVKPEGQIDWWLD